LFYFTYSNPAVWTQPIKGISERYIPKLLSHKTEKFSSNKTVGLDLELELNEEEEEEEVGAYEYINSKKDYNTTVNFVTTLGVPVNKVLGLPLVGLFISLNTVREFMNLCESANVINELPKCFQKNINDEEKSSLLGFKRTELMEEVMMERPLTDEEWKACFDVLNKTITVDICAKDEYVVRSFSFDKNPSGVGKNVSASMCTSIPPSLSSKLSSSGDFSEFDSSSLLSDNNATVDVSFTFNPLFPFTKRRVDIILTRDESVGGGQWRYTIHAQAKNDNIPISQEIVMYAAVGKSVDKVVHLVEPAHMGERYRTILKLNSSEFRVINGDGIFDKEGVADVMVRFSPEKYADERKCMLILETPTNQWQFALRGLLPVYNPPVGIKKTNTFR
jgi:hypothetical protein